MAILRTYVSDTNFRVPANNSSIDVVLWGEPGESGSSSGPNSRSSGGGNGSVVQGTLNVSEGEVIYLRRIFGGNGGNANAPGCSASGGDGGRAFYIATGNDDPSNAVAASSGGGGGGAAATDPHSESGDDTASTGGGGSGGGDSNQINGGSRIVTTSGANGDNQSGQDGGGGSSSSSNREGGAAGAGGGGGAGLNGGDGGNATGTGLTSTDVAIAHGTGGGGGGNYAGGIGSSSIQNTSTFNTASVDITFTPRPLPPEGLTVTDVEPGAPWIDLSWSLPDSVTQGYRIYRDTSTPVATTQSNLVREINISTGTSARDTGVENGDEYHYVVTGIATYNGTDYESDPSNTVSVQMARTVQVYGPAGPNDIVQWSPAAVAVFDQNDEPYYPEDIYQHDGNDWVLRDV